MTALGRHPNVLIGILLAAVVVLAFVALIGLGAPPATSPSASVAFASVAPPPRPAEAPVGVAEPGNGPAGFVDCGRIPADACAESIALARAGNEAALIDTTHIVVDDICAPEVECDRQYRFDSLVVFVTAGADFTGWRAFHAFGLDARMPTDAEPWPDEIRPTSSIASGRRWPVPDFGYASSPMPVTVQRSTPDAAPPLPADDPPIFEMDLRGLRRHWATQAALPAISAETMTGTDRRAQALGFPELRLMEHAGTAVAAAVRALATDLGRWGTGPIVILCGPGNNGGDGFVAARRLALAGASVIVAVVAAEARPRGASAARNWDRIARDSGIVKVQLPVARDVAMFGLGVEKAAVVVDALLGTGVRGALREPIRSAVEVVGRARAAGVPVVAVDTPTAVDLSSGEPSDPAVLADLTVTFHRPKTGLLTKRGAAHAGKILVAPIGIPAEADRG